MAVDARAGIFQSTPPRREVTHAQSDTNQRHVISIHTSPKGGDMGATIHIDVPKFQSTPPRREVTSYGTTEKQRHPHFNPHLPEGR